MTDERAERPFRFHRAQFKGGQQADTDRRTGGGQHGGQTDADGHVRWWPLHIMDITVGRMVRGQHPYSNPASRTPPLTSPCVAQMLIC